MSSYLHIQHNNEHVSYALTNECNKPYIEVGPNKLPLIDGTVSGLHLGVGNVGGGGNVRALEYRTESGTYYTTAVGSAGLSETTALTMSSTSGESYQTRASTSGTNYGTSEGAKSWYLSVLSTYHNNYEGGSKTHTFVRRFGDGFSWNRVYMGSSSIYGNYVNNFTIYYTTGQNAYKTLTITMQSYSQYYQPRSNSSIQTNTYSGTATFNYLILSAWTWTNAGSSSIPGSLATWTGGFNGQHTGRYYATTSYQTISYDANKVTTGTTYLTRSSTSATIYLTRSSTSGYSGKSSSSTSGWY